MLAIAIWMACAAGAAGSVLFMPGTARAQAVAASPAFVQAASAVAPQRLTLSEALSLAESANPALRTRQAQLAAAEGVQKDANALLFNNPQLSADLTRRSVPQASQSTDNRREWSAGLSQTLEVAGQRGYRREATAAALSALRAEIADARRAARTAASARFYKVLALQQRTVLEQEALMLFERTAAAIQKRRAAGEDTRLDANIAAVEAERARNQLAIAQEQLLAARSELSAAIQLPPDQLPEVDGDLAATPRPFSLADLLSSLDAQPRLRALAERENSATSRLRLEQARTYPDVTVGVSVGREGPGGFPERLTTLTVSVPLPLFKRNATDIGQARSDLSQAQIDRQVTLRNTRADVNALWLRLDSLEARLRRLQGSMLPALADNQQLSVKSQQQAGQIGLLELIVVNRQALDARRDLNDALSEYHATRLELENAAGLVTGNEPTMNHIDASTRGACTRALFLLTTVAMTVVLAACGKGDSAAPGAAASSAAAGEKGEPKKAEGKEGGGLKLSAEEAERAGIKVETLATLVFADSITVTGHHPSEPGPHRPCGAAGGRPDRRGSRQPGRDRQGGAAARRARQPGHRRGAFGAAAGAVRPACGTGGLQARRVA